MQNHFVVVAVLGIIVVYCTTMHAIALKAGFRGVNHKSSFSAKRYIYFLVGAIANT